MRHRPIPAAALTGVAPPPAPRARARGLLAPRGRAWLAAALAFLALATLAGPALAGFGCAVDDTRLANGLRVLICPSPVSSDVSIQVRYAAGARDDPGNLEGLAHVAEHLSFMGSRHVAAGEHERRLEQVGATNINGATSMDATVYVETVPAERLALALWLESDRMGYLLDRADEAALTRSRPAVLNEYRERVTDGLLGAVPEMVLAELFPKWHPYRHLPIGTDASIRRIQLADARAFLGTWYAPGNATLAIAGRVDPAEARALVQRYFASLPPRAPPQRPVLPALPPPDPAVLYVAANVTRAEVRVSWLTPARDAAGDAELEIAAAILAERGSGWLQRRLGNAAGWVGATQESRDLASVFSIRVVVTEGHRPVDVMAAIDDALAGFDRGIAEADLRRAQVGWFDEKLFRLEAIASWTAQLAAAAPERPSMGFFDGDLARYSTITPDRVRWAVRTCLGRAHRVITVVVPVHGTPNRGVLVRRQGAL